MSETPVPVSLKPIAWAALALSFLFALTVVLGSKSCIRAGIAKAAAVASVAEGRVQATERDLVQITVERDAATQARVKVESENVELKARLAARPMPKPRPVPPPGEQSAELVAAGIASPITPAEALTVWTWKARAEELPVVKARLVAAEDLLAGQSKENQALRLELEKSVQTITKMAQAHADLKDQVRALNVQIAGAVRAEKVGTVEKVLEFVAVGVLSAAAGRASK